MVLGFCLVPNMSDSKVSSLFDCSDLFLAFLNLIDGCWDFCKLDVCNTVMCTRLLVDEFVKGCTFGIEYLINSLLLRDLVDEEFGFYLLVLCKLVLL